MANQKKVLNEMYDAAQIRCKIPNSNNGRAYMGCVILDHNYCLLHVWLQQI